MRNKRNIWCTTCVMNGGNEWLQGESHLVVTSYHTGASYTYHLGHDCISERGVRYLSLAIHEPCIDAIVCKIHDWKFWELLQRSRFCQLSSDFFDALRSTVSCLATSGGTMFALGSYLGFQSKSCPSLREQSGRIKRFRLEMKRDGWEKICRMAESKNIFSYVQVFIFASRVGDT